MPEQPVLTLPGGPRSGGAYHSGIMLVFGSTDKVGGYWNPADRVVSDYMVRYWSTFARTGTPNGIGCPLVAFLMAASFGPGANDSPAARAWGADSGVGYRTQWPL